MAQSGTRGIKTGQPRGSRISTSKLLCMALLTAAALYNCRSPNYLDPGAGDKPADAYIGNRLAAALVVQAGIVLVMAAAYFLAQNSPARRPWKATEAAAALACIGGTALRAWCFATLGRLFTYEVGVRAGHSLVGEGPYALLLHPSYTGTALVGLGFSAYTGIMRRRPTALVISAVVLGAIGKSTCCPPLRIANEERVLAKHFGDAWREHASARWRLIPMIL
ncbi:Protein-S-isoprenylcysteine O-methyltransferase B [Chlorella vulgaris]